MNSPNGVDTMIVFILSVETLRLEKLSGSQWSWHPQWMNHQKLFPSPFLFLPLLYGWKAEMFTFPDSLTARSSLVTQFLANTQEVKVLGAGIPFQTK